MPWQSYDGDGRPLTARPLAAGSDTQVQFNDGGVLAGDPQLRWNKTSNRFLLDGTAVITAPNESVALMEFANAVVPSIVPQIFMDNDGTWHLFGTALAASLALNPDDTWTLLGKLTEGVTVSSLAAASATVGREIFTAYDAIDGSAATTFFTSEWNETNAGAGGVGVMGILTSRVDNMAVNGSGSADNTFATYHSTLEANIGTGFTQSAGPAGQYFISDWQVYGPIGVQPKILQGGMFLLQNQYNGSPSGAPSNGLLFITKKGLGDGNATHLAADTYPLDSAIQIRGYSTASAVDGVGWTVGIEVGGSGSPWGESKSIIGTGLHVRDYTTHGIKIDNPIGTPTASIEVDGLIIAGNLLATGSIVSITGATTATISKINICTGTSADYTVTVPSASGNAGKHISFIFGPTLTELSKAVTLDGTSSEKLGGVLTKVLWAGESCEFVSDGTNWQLVNYTANPMFAAMADSTTTNVNSGGQSKIDTDTTLSDNSGFLADTTNKRINIKRRGYYQLCGIASVNGLATSGAVLMQSLIYINGSVFSPSAGNGGVGDYFGTPTVSQTTLLVAGDYVEVYGGNFSGNTQAMAGSFSVQEMPSWAAL